MTNFPVTEARLCDLFVGSVLFGIHLVTLGHCIWGLLASGSKLKQFSEINWPMVIVAMTFGTIAAFDVALGFLHILQAFVFTTAQGGAEEVFTEISDWINVTRTVTVNIQTTLGDAMLIYRCWVVYNRSWRMIAVSTFLWLAGTVCSMIMIVLEATLHLHVLVNAKKIQPYASAFWALTIVVNILTTSMIVWRIWKVDRQSHRFAYQASGNAQQPSYLRWAMRSAIESGLLYTIVAFMTFVVYLTGGDAIYILVHAEIQVVGIAFDLIIIRVARRSAEKALESVHPPMTLPFQYVTSPELMASTVGARTTTTDYMSQEQKSDVHVLISRDVNTQPS